MNKETEKEILFLINKNYPKMNPKWNSARGKERHLRITQNANLSEIKNLFGLELKKEHNTKYSSSYYTMFFKYKEEIFPLILSQGNLKINKKGDKIVTKSLTPSKIGISGKYYNEEELINNVKILLNKLNINFETNQVLLSLMEKAKNKKYQISEKEWDFYSKNYNSINKDFGEILIVIELFKNKEILYIEFPNDSNNALYDIIVEYKDGEKELINIKSENGSGQSFRTIPYKYIEEAKNNSNFFRDGTYYDKYIKILDIFHSKLKGREKHIEMFKILYNGLDDLSELLFKFKTEFYIDDFKTLKKDKMSFIEYKEISERIFNEKNIKSIGIPIGTKNQNIEDYFKDNLDLEGVLIFTLSTIIAKYHNQEIFNKTIKKILINNVINISIKKDNKNNIFKIERKENPEYKIHYWANAKAPTNNLMGYKVF